MMGFCSRLIERMKCAITKKQKSTENTGVTSPVCAAQPESTLTAENSGNAPIAADQVSLNENIGKSIRGPMLLLQSLKIICLKCKDAVFVDQEIKSYKCSCGKAEVLGNASQFMIMSKREDMVICDDSGLIFMGDVGFNSSKSVEAQKEMH